MSERASDGLFCEDCDQSLSHDDIKPAGPATEIEPETEDVGNNVAELYRCRGCGLVVAYAVR